MTVQAADQVPDAAAPNANQSQITQTLDGTAVQNIVTPNAAGLSHNKFTTFNVNTKGLVINNSSIDVVSNIGGALLANPNLANGEASLILNEVTSAERSILLGTQELVGSRADYILANPNGITCDGCGFMNFPRATLTTGAPVLSGDNLTGFDVDNGDIAIESLGLNAEQADYFDIISRSIAINGAIHANDLNLIAGRNTVDYATKVATAKPDDGSTQPLFAIDSSALGGMYANRITLVGTEAGVGVSMLGDMAASVDDITLDVDGKITFNGNEVTAERNIIIESTEPAATGGDEIELTGSTVYAGNNLDITGGDMMLDGGRAGAGMDITITANSYTDTGSGLRDAGNDLLLDVTGDATVSSNLQAVNNATITAANLTLNAGQVVAATNSTGNLDVIVTDLLELLDGALDSGNTASINAATITLDTASNDGGSRGIYTAGSATINAASSLTNDGYIGGGADLAVISSNNIDNNGYIGSAANLTVSAGTVIDNYGYIIGDASLTVNAPELTNRDGGVLQSSLTDGTLNLENNGAAGTILNTEVGSEIKANSLNIDFSTINNDGSLYSATDATITASILNNDTDTGDGSVAKISSSGSLTLTSGGPTLTQPVTGSTLTNQGNVESSTLSLSYDTLDNSGEIYTENDATYYVNSLDNSGDLLSGTGALSFNSHLGHGTLGTTTFTNTGTLDAVYAAMSFSEVTNDSTLYAVSGMSIVADQLDNHASIFSDGTLGLYATTLNNTPTLGVAADIIANGFLVIADNHTLNNIADGGITPGIMSLGSALDINSTAGTVSTQSINNDGGFLYGALGLKAIVSRQLINQNSGIIFSAAGTLHLGAPDSATLLGTTDVVTIQNMDSRIENDSGDIDIFADYFLNSTNEDHSSLVSEVTYIRTEAGILIQDPLNPFVYTAAPTCGSTSFSSSFMIGGTCRTFYKETYDEYVVDPGVGLTYPNPVKKFYWEYAGVKWGIDGDNCGTINDPNFYVGDSCVKSVTVTEEYLPSGTNFIQRSALIAGTDIDIWIETEAKNYVSLISAGGDLTVDGPAGSEFINEAISLNKTESSRTYVDKDGGVYPFGEFECGATTYLLDLTGLTCFWVGSEVHYKSWNVSATLSTDTPSYGIPSTVEAGGTITVGTNVTNSNAPGGSNNYVSAPVSTTDTQDPNLSGSVNTLNTDPTISGSIDALASSPFFITNTDPTSPFVYVTDPKFASLTALYGSDLLIEGLGYDPYEYMRLGDGYYEQQLVRSQLLAEAGQRFIADGFYDENEQYKYLLSNGIEAGKDLQLRLGVALTAEQINNLEKDIVWMVETVVDGQTVLVPQLYLSNTTRANLAGGAKFVASTINVTTEGPVTNSGAFVANDVTIDSGTFTNRLGRVIATEDLNITTEGDILNQSGTIRGGNVTLTSEEGSVRNTTLTREHEITGALGSGTNTEVGDIATIEATNDLTINAGEDIVSEGGQLNAGNNATLDAEGEIELTVIEVSSYTETHEVSGTGTDLFNATSTDTVTSIDHTGSLGSGLNVGGDLSVSSGGDTNVIGSDVAVGGDLNVEKIGGNLNVTTYEDTTVIHSTTRTDTVGGGGTVETDESKGNHAATSTAKAELSYSSETTTTDITATTHNRSGISVGGNINSSEGAIAGDANITGSDVAAGGDINLDAQGDINILAAEDKIEMSYTSDTNTIGIGASASVDGVSTEINYENEHAEGSATQTTAQVSTLTSGGDMNLTAAGDLTEQGTQVSAGGDINIEADSVNSLAAENTYTETGTIETNSVGLTISAETGLGDVVGSFIGEDGNAAFDQGQAAKSIGALDVPDAGSVSGELSYKNEQTTHGSSANEAVVSSFASGGNVNITAREGDATFEGTSVEAAGSIDVTAEEGDVRILAAESTESSYSDTQTVDVSVSYSPAEQSGSLSGGYSTEHQDSKSTTNTVASFRAGEDVNLTAKNDVEMVGTEIEAGGTAAITAEEGGIEYKAAYDTTESNSSSMSAHGSVSGGGGEGGVGGGYSESQTHESSSTGQAGSIKAGNISFNAKEDITLEGTNIEAEEEVSVTTEGKLDYKAVTDTYERTSTGMSAEGEISGGKSGGELSGGGSGTDEYEQSTTRTGGTLSASTLTIKTGQGARLEGTDVTADSASIDTGEGGLVIESAVSTHTKTVNNTAVEGGISGDKDGSGSANLSVEGEYEDTYSRTNQNANLNVGNLDIKAKEGIEVKGAGITGLESVVTGDRTEGGTINTNGADVDIEIRTDESRSEKSNINVSVGVVVPSKKLRDKTIGKVADKVGGSKTFKDAKNKLGDVSTGIKNKTAEAGTGIKNKVSDVKTSVKNIGADTATRDTNNKANETRKQDNNTKLAGTIKTNKDKNTDTKLANNTKYADNKATKATSKIDSKQSKYDQKADYDRQKADTQAEKTRDAELAKIDEDTNLTDTDRAQKKQEVQERYTNKIKENADTATNTKKENAVVAAGDKLAYAEKTAARKDAAQDKAATSRTQHAEDTADTKVALADKVSDTTERDRLKTEANDAKTQSVNDIAKQKNDAKAEITAQKEKTVAQVNVDRDRKKSDLDVQVKADKEIADIEASKTLSQGEKETRKAEIQSELANEKSLNETKAQKDLAVENARAEEKLAEATGADNKEQLSAKREEQESLRDAFDDKRSADNSVKNDGNLSPQDKADKLKENSDNFASAQETARTNYTGKIKADADTKDNQARTDEKSAIDNSSLSDADKQAKKKEIDEKYDEQKQLRQDEYNQQIADYKSETRHAKDVAGAEHKQQQAVIDSDKELSTAKNKSDTDKAARDQAAEDAKNDAVSNIDSNLSDADREKEKQKIEDKYQQDIEASGKKRDEEIAAAEKIADKKKQNAAEELEQSRIIADSALEKDRRDADARRDEIRTNEADIAAKHRMIEASRTDRDEKLSDAEKARDDKIDEIEAQYNARDDVKQANEAYEQKIKRAEDTRNDLDTIAQAKYERDKRAIEGDTKISDTKRAEKLANIEAVRDAAKQKNEEREQNTKDDANTQLNVDLADARSEMHDAKSDALSAYDDNKTRIDADHKTNIKRAYDQAVIQKTLAQEKRKQELAISDAQYKKTEEDLKVVSDDSLDERQKALKLQKNAEDLAQAKEDAQVEILKAEVKAKNDQDDRDREYEKSLVNNSDLSDDDKNDKLDAIDEKYDNYTFKDSRQAELDRQIEVLKLETKHAKDIADAEYEHRIALADSKSSMAVADNSKNIRDNAAELNKELEKARIDSNLSADERKAKEDEIEKTYQDALKDSEKQHKEDVEKAKVDAEKNQHVANAKLKRDQVIVDAEFEKKRNLAQADEDDPGRAREKALVDSSTEFDPAEKQAKKDEIDRKYDEQKQKKKDAIEEAYTKKVENMDSRLAAWNKDIEGRFDGKTAANKLARDNALVDADDSLTPAEKKQQKSEHQKEYDMAHKEAQKKIDEAKSEFDKLLTPEEKQAKARLAENNTETNMVERLIGDKKKAVARKKATVRLADALITGKKGESDTRVSNPYAKWPRVKHHLASTKRWKSILTSVRVSGAINEFAEEEEDEIVLPAVPKLLVMAQQFSPDQEGKTMVIIPASIRNDESIQKAMVLSMSTDEIREEAREGLIRDMMLERHGTDLGVLTTDDKLAIMKEAGIDVNDANQLEIINMFDAYLDEVVEAMPLTVNQKREMLMATGDIKMNEEGSYVDENNKLLSDSDIEKIYGKVVQEGMEAIDSKTPPGRAGDYKQTLVPALI